MDERSRSGGDAEFRALASRYVEAVSRGELRPDDPVAVVVEARDPAGRLRALGLATRDVRQGRFQDAAARLGGIAMSNPEARRAVASQAEALRALAAGREARRSPR